MTPLQNFMGSFIEVCSIFCLLNLFSSDYLRRKWKVIMIALIVAAVNTATYNGEYSYDFFLYYGIFIMLNWKVFQIKILDALFQLCFGIGISLLIQFALISGMGYLNLDPSHIKVIAVNLISGFLISWVIGNHKKLQNIVRRICLVYHSEINNFFLNVFIVALCSKWIWESAKHNFFGEQPVLTVVIIFWCTINIYLLIKLMQNKKQKDLIELHEQYVEMTENLLDDLYKGKHEFNRHLQMVLGLSRLDESEIAIKEIYEYISEIKDQKEVQKEGNFSTGDGIVNAFLYCQRKKAVEEQIAFYYLPSGLFPNFPCEKHELIEIIGNLLSNAFEHVIHLEVQERKVFLKIGENMGKPLIEVRNVYRVGNGELEHHMLKKGYTTKEGTRRGYGLTNVKAIALKYKGKVSIYNEGSDIIVAVLF